MNRRLIPRTHGSAAGRSARAAIVISIFAASILRAEESDDVTGLTRLRESFATDRFVVYAPTHYDPLNSPLIPARATDIRADLATLRPFFSGLVTYSCDPRHGLDEIVPIAARTDFRVILGVWDLWSPAEFDTAVRLTREYPRTVVGIILGNEVLLRGGRWDMIEHAFENFRRKLPDIPLSTSEPIDVYDREALRRLVDFHSPICHWIYAADGAERAQVEPGLAWLQERIVDLRGRTFGEKPILLKEHGLPAGPAPFTPALQADYWRQACGEFPHLPELAIVFMEAFDLPWKPQTNPTDLSASEAHWGAWRADRTAKPVVAEFRMAGFATASVSADSADPKAATAD